MLRPICVTIIANEVWILPTRVAQRSDRCKRFDTIIRSASSSYEIHTLNIVGSRSHVDTRANGHSWDGFAKARARRVGVADFL